ncbi:MAG: TorF family putative porin [Opitutales bacterium]|jgi:uncharacterized protein (TIGR02001 family)
MKIKNTTAIVAAILAGASFASAQELSVSTAVAYESDYIFRGVRYADEFIAPSIDISYGDFYAGIWAALPVDSPETAGDIESEVDFYAGYGFGLSETVSADVGFTYYTFPNEADGLIDGDVNTFEIYGGLSFEAPLSPAVYAFYDFDLKAFTLEVSAGHSVEVSETTSVDFSAYLGWVDADGYDYLYYGAGASYVVALAENASWSIGVNYYGADEAMEADGSKNKITLSTSFSAGF